MAGKCGQVLDGLLVGWCIIIIVVIWLGCWIAIILYESPQLYNSVNKRTQNIYIMIRECCCLRHKWQTILAHWDKSRYCRRAACRASALGSFPPSFLITGVLDCKRQFLNIYSGCLAFRVQFIQPSLHIFTHSHKLLQYSTDLRTHCFRWLNCVDHVPVVPF